MEPKTLTLTPRFPSLSICIPRSGLVEVPLDGLREVLVGDVAAGGPVHDVGVGGARGGALVLDPVVDVLGAHVELAVAVGAEQSSLLYNAIVNDIHL